MWFEDQTLLARLKAAIESAEWADWQAASVFRKIQKNLPVEMRDRTRIGALVIDEIEGTEGLNCWMQPAEGYKKLLARESKIRLVSKDGQVLFEGKWKETSARHIETGTEFFIWLAPKIGRDPVETSLWLRIKGLFRYAKNRRK